MCGHPQRIPGIGAVAPPADSTSGLTEPPLHGMNQRRQCATLPTAPIQPTISGAKPSPSARGSGKPACPASAYVASSALSSTSRRPVASRPNRQGKIDALPIRAIALETLGRRRHPRAAISYNQQRTSCGHRIERNISFRASAFSSSQADYAECP